tara:strand:- start:3626 stop:3856 length:231 start_codon:yes stop_codon:yes gene_type:complete
MSIKQQEQDLISVHNRIEDLKNNINQLEGRKQMILSEIKKDNPEFDEDNFNIEKTEQQINTNLKVLNSRLESFQKG